MDSLNVPLPPAVERVAEEVAPELRGLDRRDPYTLLVKRLNHGGPDAEKRVRRALSDMPPFEVRIDEIGVFYEPTSGSSPVVYLAVESPGIREAHERLCDVVDPVPGLEGEDYVPHVTLARGDEEGPSFGLETSTDVARRLEGQSVGPVRWTVEQLVFFDSTYREPSGRVSLPA
ncbi:MAG: 2'-5' RNA ligase family protein [Halobacteriaceae archaeon]